MGRMVLVLRADAAQEAALDELLRAQQDPASRYYHRWLTPEQFGRRFGVSQNDLAQVTKWLRSLGMEVEEIPASHRAVIFSGTAAQVESAFQTKLQRYRVRGQEHLANATDPAIPRSLATVVSGVVSLHDFRSAPSYIVAPNYTASNGAHFLMPQDWAMIYDVTPLYNQGTRWDRAKYCSARPRGHRALRYSNVSHECRPLAQRSAGHPQRTGSWISVVR